MAHVYVPFLSGVKEKVHNFFSVEVDNTNLSSADIKLNKKNRVTTDFDCLHYLRPQPFDGNNKVNAALRSISEWVIVV